MSTFKVTGIDKVSGALRALAASMPAQAAQALNAVAEETSTDAKVRCPVLTGNLRRSITVHQHATPQKLIAGISFGTEYGVYVHENLFARHKTGEAKFLENALKFTATFFEERIANMLNLSGRGGTGAGSPGGSGNL